MATKKKLNHTRKWHFDVASCCGVPSILPMMPLQPPVGAIAAASRRRCSARLCFRSHSPDGARAEAQHRHQKGTFILDPVITHFAIPTSAIAELPQAPGVSGAPSTIARAAAVAIWKLSNSDEDVIMMAQPEMQHCRQKGASQR